MGCTSSSDGSGGVVNSKSPKKHSASPSNYHNQLLDEKYASANHICDFLAPSDLPRNPYRQLDARPLFVVKSRLENKTKVFVNMFRSNEVAFSVIENSKYQFNKNEEECDVYNVVLRDHAKYFKDEKARDQVCRRPTHFYFKQRG